jgi:hypothetical protein
MEKDGKMSTTANNGPSGASAPFSNSPMGQKPQQHPTAVAPAVPGANGMWDAVNSVLARNGGMLDTGNPSIPGDTRPGMPGSHAPGFGSGQFSNLSYPSTGSAPPGAYGGASDQPNVLDVVRRVHQAQMGGMPAAAAPGYGGMINSALSGGGGDIASIIARVHAMQGGGGGTNLPGGPGLPSSYYTPVGPVEAGLGATMGAGQANPFIASLARGEIPSGMMQQYQQQAAQNQAMIGESMGGARFGSDYAGAVQRENMRALTNLLSGTQQNAANVYFQGTNPLLQQEVNRSNLGQGLAQQDFTNQSQQSMQLLQMLAAYAGLGGGTTNTSGTSGPASPAMSVVQGLLTPPKLT